MTEPSAPPVLDGDHEDQKPQSGFSAPAGFERFPKRKVALCVGYLGTNYSGLQRNPGVHSIDDDLEKALLEAGCISSNSVVKKDSTKNN
jgi:tRNA pseudouridine38-40 synthase